MKKYLLILLFFGMYGNIPVFSNTGHAVTPIDTLFNVPAPRFTMLDTKGKVVNLTDFKDKVVVMCFWSTWCYYCHKDFPMIDKVMKQYANDSSVVFLFVDTRETSAQYKELVQKDMEKYGYDFHVVFDEKGEDGVQSKYYDAFGTIGLPTRFIIDGDMIIRHKFVGYDPRLTEEEAAAAFIRSIEDTRKLTSSAVPKK